MAVGADVMIIKMQYIRFLFWLVVICETNYILGCSANHPLNPVSQKCQPVEHNTYVKSIRFSNDGKRLFSQGDLDGQIIMWNLDAMSPAKVLVSPFQGSLVWGTTKSEFEISPNGKLLAYARGTDVYLYDYGIQRDVFVFREETGSTDSITFLSSGKYIAISGNVWDIKERKKINEIITDVPWQISAIPQKEILVFGCNKTVALYDIHTKVEIQKIRVFTTEGHVGQALFTSDGKRGFALNEHGNLSYFNVDIGEVIKAFWPHQLWGQYKIGIEKIILDESRGRLYGVSMSYMHFYVSVFDLEKGDLQKVTKRALPIPMDRDPNAGQEILDAVLSPDGQTLAIAGEDCQILLLDIETLETKGVLGKGCQVAPRSYRDSMKIN